MNNSASNSSQKKDAIIVALDFPTPAEAEAMVNRLGDQITFYKIGLELLFAGGQDLAKQLLVEGKRVFIDAKLLDIGATVEKSTANIAKIGADFLTLHITDHKTLASAVKGRGESQLKLLGVTVMTNLDAQDLIEQGITDKVPSELVLHRAKLAQQAGLDGVIASAEEAAQIREMTGPDFLIITPGIRPSGADKGDQQRVMTPAKAMAAGANHLVIGRPITQSEDPKTAAEAIWQDIREI